MVLLLISRMPEDFFNLENLGIFQRSSMKAVNLLLFEDKIRKQSAIFSSQYVHAITLSFINTNENTNIYQDMYETVDGPIKEGNIAALFIVEST